MVATGDAWKGVSSCKVKRWWLAITAGMMLIGIAVLMASWPATHLINPAFP